MLFFNILRNRNIINNYRRALIAIERLMSVFLPVVQNENVFKFTKEREKDMLLLRGVSRIFSSEADFIFRVGRAEIFSLRAESRPNGGR